MTMSGETFAVQWVRPWLARALAFLAVGAGACAKTDVQAPAKEAPSAQGAAPEAAEMAPQQERAASPSTTGTDRWPQAETQPGTAGGSPPAAAAPSPAPAPKPRPTGEE